MSSKLGKKNTVKRKIQMRHYFEEQLKSKKHYSDPFANPESTSDDDDSYWKDMKLPSDQGLKIQLKTRQEEPTDDSSSDDILNSHVNLDEADYFLASLNMPKNTKKDPIKKVKPIAQAPTLKEQATLRSVAQKLSKLRQVETQGAEEEDDENLI